MAKSQSHRHRLRSRLGLHRHTCYIDDKVENPACHAIEYDE
jgi:hypothetical protein